MLVCTYWKMKFLNYILEFLGFYNQLHYQGLIYNYGLTVYLILRKGPLSLLLRRFSEIFGQWLVSRDSSWQYVQRTRVFRCPQCLQCSFPVPRHFRPQTWKTASLKPLEVKYCPNWSYQNIFFKVHIFWEGHKLSRNLHLTFDCMYCSQK